MPTGLQQLPRIDITSCDALGDIFVAFNNIADSLERHMLQEKKFNQTALERLLLDFSISITEMFRDPSFFSSFRTQVVPLLHHYSHIRIWLAGCSTGEEVFSRAKQLSLNIIPSSMSTLYSMPGCWKMYCSHSTT